MGYVHKSLRNGGITIKIDRWAPSTKTCSDCGHIQNITLDIRTYICANCGLEIDRDFNASLNIKRLVIELINRMGTIQISYDKNNACGDTYVGESLTSDSSYVSLKQENRTNGFDACDF
jgi:transposase